jgi:hypothetical protein
MLDIVNKTMNLISKTIIPNREWIIKNDREKIGSISKTRKGFVFLRQGKKYNFKSLEQLDVDLSSETQSSTIDESSSFSIYDYPCNSRPFASVFNLKKKLPLFAKNNKTKSFYCAGFYVIKFRNKWIKSFCPKLITLERYPFYGPFKDQEQAKILLDNIEKS